MDMAVVGKIIKQYRERKRLSQEVLSGLANVDRSYLSKIESGAHNFTIAVLYKLADALGVNASELLSAIEEENRKTQKERETEKSS
ncbi:MAG: helix-turn-helix domain-containing protein [Oscillospiraceae bacterium]|jgi:transcriptional regulator with XRE-family HTH domain|nr:helix-turn-helix domain-containing protein [Oscillospiraceae bacterium]